ncbi:phosphohydrolase [Prevotella sp. F0091]|uniref:phosphohydrolase n=1 Tax=Prevotella sp. F0091 TaxID=1227276 RepID=UPI0025EC4097|nr:phosphohydrolase [Prevotella sp. F0091]
MLSNKEKVIVQSAADIACQLHKGQKDKAGVDYFTGHLSAVTKMGNTWQEQVVGYLHDASEDTPNSVEEVLNLLDEKLESPLSEADREELATALRLLNHHLSPDRETYIQRIKSNALVTKVKLHDLTHNMDLSRIPNPTQKDCERVERYKSEYDYLSRL